MLYYQSLFLEKYAGVAQLVEHLTCNQGVVGSSPIAGTISVCGEIAKWLNAADCKSAPSGFGGSNPSLPTMFNYCEFAGMAELADARDSKS